MSESHSVGIFVCSFRQENNKKETPKNRNRPIFFMPQGIKKGRNRIRRSSLFLMIIVMIYFADAYRFATSVQLITLKNAAI